MSEIYKAGEDYIGYEYKELIVDKKQVSFCLDSFENFGWEIDQRYAANMTGNHPGKVVICLKRNRKIVNKAELTRLQRHFEDCMKQMERLENSKTSFAMAVSLAIGIFGTAFIAGSVFAVTHEPPQILLCIILAVPGFAGWALPALVYRRMIERRAQELEPLIEKKMEEMYEICEKGHKLIV